MDEEGEARGSAFTWEQAYTEGLNIRSVLQEDEHGSVEESIRRLVMDEKRQRRMERRPAKIRLGIMRYVYLAIDCSAAVLSSDFLPSRLSVVLDGLRNYVDKFFEINPVSQMGIILVRDKRAERLCGFTSSVQLLRESLLSVTASACGGEFSLQSALQCALHSLHALPAHSSKECILAISSLSTIDPSNIRHTFEQLKMHSVRCSIIAFGAEVFAFKRLCTTTEGKYSVALDDQHLALLLDEQVQPPPVKRQQGQQDTIVRMGFPQRRRVLAPSFCACHELSGEAAPPSVEEQSDGSTSSVVRAFFCPQCGARYCQTPVECRICGLLLLTAPQLARAHQHLEPLATFSETALPEDAKNDLCFACDEPLLRKAYTCPRCSTNFCIDCDLLLHESLQVCPACD